MDTPGINFTDILMPQLKDRQIYNVFINSCVKKESLERYRGYAVFDMAPTILESIGAKLEGRQFGLGTSLFSKKKTLVEKYGISHINNELKKRSEFYEDLIW
jgi:phosphoglycerol transferase